jgi:hypothetical protein
LKAVLVVAVLVLAGFGAFRALSGKSDDTSDAIVNAITVPIDRAARIEAEANLRAADSAAQLYLTQNGSYAGISTDALRAIDAGLSPTVHVVASGGGYCATAVVRGVSFHTVGPGGEIADGGC